MTLMEQPTYAATPTSRFVASRALDRDDTPITVHRETLKAGCDPLGFHSWEMQEDSEEWCYTFDEAKARAQYLAEREALSADEDNSDAAC